MDISSGSPNRCPACGNEVRIEPSSSFGETRCTNCGRLLWFAEIRGEPHFFLAEELDSLDFVELVMDLEEDK